jgi:hypothetical protein
MAMADPSQGDQLESDPAERLDRFLADRLANVARRLPPDGAPLDAAIALEIGVLDDLSRLRREHLRPPVPPKRPYLVRGLFVATGIVITALIFVPLPVLQAEMDVSCSAVTFETRDAVLLTTLSPLKVLQAGGFEPTELEDPATDKKTPLRPIAEFRPRDDGSLTLSPVTVPPNSRVSIRKGADANAWRLEIESVDARIAATLAHAVSVSLETERPLTIDFGRGRSVDLKAANAKSPLELDFTATDPATLLVRRNIRITKIAFDELFEEATPEGVGIVHGRASSIIKGTIFNESLGGRQKVLRNRENVEADVAEGVMRELRLEPDGVHLNLSASMRELKTGTAGALQTLRPSYLEWLAEHHALKLAWASAAWIFGLMAGGVRWWRASDVH